MQVVDRQELHAGDFRVRGRSGKRLRSSSTSISPSAASTAKIRLIDSPLVEVAGCCFLTREILDGSVSPAWRRPRCRRSRPRLRAAGRAGTRRPSPPGRARARRSSRPAPRAGARVVHLEDEPRDAPLAAQPLVDPHHRNLDHVRSGALHHRVHGGEPLPERAGLAIFEAWSSGIGRRRPRSRRDVAVRRHVRDRPRDQFPARAGVAPGRCRSVPAPRRADAEVLGEPLNDEMP